MVSSIVVGGWFKWLKLQPLGRDNRPGRQNRSGAGNDQQHGGRIELGVRGEGREEYGTTRPCRWGTSRKYSGRKNYACYYSTCIMIFQCWRYKIFFLYLFFNSLSEFKFLSLNFIFLSIQQIMVGVFPVFATQRDDSS